MSNIVALETSPKSMIQSVAENYFEVFDVIQANRSKTLKSRDIKSSQVHRRYKSMPNMAVRFNSADDVSDIELPAVASMVELQVSTVLPSTELSVTTTAPAEVEEIEAPLNILSSLPRVWLVEDDVLQSSLMYSTAAVQFDGAESENCPPGK